MTLLDCAVTGCAYNEDRCCCKGNIKVEGSEAVHQNETCCGSFVERGEKSCGCNVKEHESKKIDVACEACNCTFNENKKCSADHIGIAGGNACSCGETEEKRRGAGGNAKRFPVLHSGGISPVEFSSCKVRLMEVQ